MWTVNITKSIIKYWFLLKYQYIFAISMKTIDSIIWNKLNKPGMNIHNKNNGINVELIIFFIEEVITITTFDYKLLLELVGYKS